MDPPTKSTAEQFPLAYLITIRSFGTWLHGSEDTRAIQYVLYEQGEPIPAFDD